MTTSPTRTLTRPALRLRPRRAIARRRRSRWHVPAPVPVAAVGARLDGRIRVYLAGALVLAVVILYVAQSAQVTAISYRIESLQSQQQDLLAEQAQLRYEEASLQAPARVQSDAARAGLTRVQPAGYVAYKATGADLARPLDAPTPDPSPGWYRLLASVWGGGPF